ncbi:GSCOCG00013134001-RA-CDS [Cotesia congregata]|uniref:Chitin synthase-like protein CHITS n=1 Tax=Cotesia congregata TaxID=51543 RepID=S6CWN0_COTCN|nr:GSCOCG00013134001-RA-CDS [Cotesia congregata]CAG5092610.1 Similar to chs-2: Chitin synthase chs-2 (Caenorhabditis elegans) [Cotesia congregata]CCQ71310.1 chitin synthase-like protein CHITS [Cotesia congregata]
MPDHHQPDDETLSDYKTEDNFSDNDELPLTNEPLSISIVDRINKSLKTFPMPSSFKKFTSKLWKLVSFLLFIMYVMLFMISCIVSKSTLLSMTSQLEPNHTAYCRKRQGSFEMMRLELVQSEEERIMWIWCLLLAFAVPELVNSVVCFRKSKSRPSICQFLQVMGPETLHVVGIAVMIFVILPEIDMMRFWLLCIWFIFDMGLLNLLTRVYNNAKSKRNTALIVLDCIILANLAIINIVFSLHESTFYDHSFWAIMLASICIFFGFWQDTSYSILSPTGYIQIFNSAREKLFPARHFTFALISIWKIVVFFASALTILYLNGDNIVHIFTKLGQTFGEHNLTLIEDFNKREVYYNGTIVSLETIISIKNGKFIFTISILLTQILLSILSNVEDDKGGLRMLHGFDFRSRLGWNIPLSFSFGLVIWTFYVLEPFCKLNHDMIIPRYLSFDSRERGLKKELDFHNNTLSETWKVIGSIVSVLWIGIHTIIRYYKIMVENKKPQNFEYDRPLFNRWLSSLRAHKDESIDVEKELMTFQRHQEIHLDTLFQ